MCYPNENEDRFDWQLFCIYAVPILLMIACVVFLAVKGQ